MLPSVTLLDDDENGQIELANEIKLRIAEADVPGDGTVPWQSGAVPQKMLSVAKQSLRRYFDFYNSRRPHSALDGKTPDMAYFNLTEPPLAAAA